MKKERIIKLPIGEQNVLLTKIKAGHAEGVKRPVKLKDRPTNKVLQFNTPTLCVTLRKAG